MPLAETPRGYLIFDGHTGGTIKVLLRHRCSHGSVRRPAPHTRAMGPLSRPRGLSGPD